MNYPYLVIPDDVVALMQRCLARATTHATDNLLKCFEAYCHVTGSGLSYVALSSPSFRALAKGFLGALADESFVSVTQQTRNRYAREFNKLLNEMRKEIPLMQAFTQEEMLPFNNEHIWAAQKNILDAEAVHYWNGWEVKGRRNQTAYLPICLLWNSHGREFAEKIYTRYAQHVEKLQAPAHSEFKLFITHLSRNASKWPESTFQNPLTLKRFFIENLGASFMATNSREEDYSAKTADYAQFIYHIEQAFIHTGVWARPFTGTLPHPVPIAKLGIHSNIKKLADGTLVKEKLITPVPLKLTDSEAIEIIFKSIKADNQLVLEWAKSKINGLALSRERRILLASTGTPILCGKTYKKSLDEVGINDLCATFESFGIKHIREGERQIYGKSDVSDIPELLAIPTVHHFFALQLLLIAEHQCLTDSFFADFELYDKRGNLSGFLPTDSGHTLIGFKDRKGGRLSEQVITLSPEQEEWVRLIISATEPLRYELKSKGDDAWRYLFLRCTRYIGIPKQAAVFKISKHNITRHDLLDEFLALSNRTKSDTMELLSRLSLTAYRASKAVEVYLDTNNVEAMAKALGHTTYNASLLSRYLPEPILAFFQTRWIRVFQKGIICVAMKDSPYLLRAAQFESMEELHEFLENHAIRPLPEHLQNPNAQIQSASDPENTTDESQVLITIDTGTLTALLSVKLAVSRAPDLTKVCSKAIYWSKFADLVVQDIESKFNDDLQNHLNIAYRHADASHMEKLIYETATRA